MAILFVCQQFCAPVRQEFVSLGFSGENGERNPFPQHYTYCLLYTILHLQATVGNGSNRVKSDICVIHVEQK
jgi:hypothetical protein